jgi:hypothetical protein
VKTALSLEVYNTHTENYVYRWKYITRPWITKRTGRIFVKTGFFGSAKNHSVTIQKIEKLKKPEKIER